MGSLRWEARPLELFQQRVSSCQTVPRPPQRQDRSGRVGDTQRPAAWLTSRSSSGVLSSAPGPALLGEPHPAQAVSFPAGGNVQARCTKSLLEACIPLTLSS